MKCLIPQLTGPARRGGKATMKKETSTKQRQLVLEGMARSQLLEQVLEAHGYKHDFHPIFPISLWWTGSP